MSMQESVVFKILDDISYYFQDLHPNKYELNASLYVLLGLEVSGRNAVVVSGTNVTPRGSISVGSFYTFYRSVQPAQLKAKP